MDDWRARRRYRRAVRWAFARVTFYREQWAAAGEVLAAPVPTRLETLPQPPHTLVPFSRPWLPDREPSLWTPSLRPLARALRAAGCRDRAPVLEVRESLADHDRLPGVVLRRGTPYRALLSVAAVVASAEHRAALNREALSVLDATGTGWVVAGPDELAALPEVGDSRLRLVRRLPVAAAGDTGAADLTGPAVLYEPMLGYLGARVPDCGQLHLDTPRVYPRERDGLLTLSLPADRRPVLLDLVPAGAERVAVAACPHHGTSVLRPRPDPEPADGRPTAASTAA